MTSHLLSSPPPAPPSQRPSSTATPLPSSYVDKTATSLSVPVAGEPPTYSPSADVPAYSVAPAPSERTLAVTARARRRTYTGVFVRSNSLITVALRGQDEYALSPSYGRGGMISGDVGLRCTQGVQAVFVKVRTAASLYVLSSLSFFLSLSLHLPSAFLTSVDYALVVGGPSTLGHPRGRKLRDTVLQCFV